MPLGLKSTICPAEAYIIPPEALATAGAGGGLLPLFSSIETNLRIPSRISLKVWLSKLSVVLVKDCAIFSAETSAVLFAISVLNLDNSVLASDCKLTPIL